MADAADFQVSLDLFLQSARNFGQMITMGSLYPETTIAPVNDNSPPNPLFVTGVISLAIAFVAYGHSLMSGLTFVIDRSWSAIPPAFLVIYAVMAQAVYGSVPSRLLWHCAVVCLWGARLTYNFYRKGGYWGNEEDYRWSIVRQWKVMQYMAVKQMFNLLFYALYQSFLIWSFCFPAYLSYMAPNDKQSMTSIDYAAVLLTLIFLIGETVADQQQWNFHQKKRGGGPEAKSDDDCRRGFLSSGFFRYSRHPNYFCEIMFWYSTYLFGVSASGKWVNWTLTGPVLLNLLFLGSTALTEHITLGKYPEYSAYQASTSAIIPWPVKNQAMAKRD